MLFPLLYAILQPLKLYWSLVLPPLIPGLYLLFQNSKMLFLCHYYFSYVSLARALLDNNRFYLSIRILNPGEVGRAPDPEIPKGLHDRISLL